MTARGIAGRAAIIGMGCTRFGERWDSSAGDLMLDASRAATSAAGIELGDVDALWLGTHASGMSGTALARPLELEYKPVTRVENRCATGSDALRHACHAVLAGVCDVAMAVGVEKLKDSGHAGLARTVLADDGTRAGVSAPGFFGLIPPAYRAEFGITEPMMRQVLARIAWKNHANGSRNPLAQFRRVPTLEEIMAAPAVAGELGVLDCSGVADGAAAAIVVRSEDARRYRSDPVFVEGLSLVAGTGRHWHTAGSSVTSIPEVVVSATRAYEEAGVTRPADELALAEVHDCFTITELILMEDLGFSERGYAWKDVLSGRFDLGGELPVNPDGGLKSFGHPVGASGLRMMFECWLQLRGEAGDRQIDNGRTRGLVQNLGGTPDECVSVVTVLGTGGSR